MKEDINQLEPGDIASLKEKFEVMTFAKDFDVFYEEQIPVAGIALVQGKIEMIKKSRPFKTITTSCLIGISQLLNSVPSSSGCRIKKDSQIIFLGKSDLLSLLKNKRSKITKAIHKNDPIIS